MNARPIFLFIAILLASFSLQAQLLWKISGTNLNTTSYILGSHHVAPPTMLDSITGLKQAMEKCDAIYGEVKKDALTSPEAQQQIMLRSMAPADSTLDKVLTPQQFAQLDSLLGAYIGIPGLAQQLIPFVPAMVSTQLAVLMSQKAFPDFDAANVFDVAIMSLGESLAKPIEGFETLEDQLDVMYGDPISMQAQDLIDEIEKEETMIEYARKLAQAYTSQNLDAIYDIMKSEDCEFTESQWERLINNRNANWINKLQLLLPMRNMFIVVGAGHLPGEKGVLQMLRNCGYEVVPVEN